MGTIGTNLQALKQRIAGAAAACGRNPSEITLIAVSKTCAAADVATAYDHGQRDFGENYVQEAVAKIAALSGLIPGLRVASAEREYGESSRTRIDGSVGVAPEVPRWHFIGPIQSNKTRTIAENFAWVHSIERLSIAERISAARPTGLPPLQVCIQINIGGEKTKSGVTPGEAMALAPAVAALPNLNLRGFMAIPPISSDRVQQRAYFAQLRSLKAAVVATGVPLDTLSMGMSEDFEVAIMEGATQVRVGTAVFGKRQVN